MSVNSLISVIIPIYNTELYLKRCIDSVLAQTYKNLEILLVDDGSTDLSGSICDDYFKTDKRIKVFHIKNCGLSGARNFGINKATGKYLGFVDSDDWIAENMFEILFTNLEKHQADVSVCSAAWVHNKTVLKNNNKNIENIKMTGEEAIEKIFFNKKCGVSAWNKLYKKELFTSIKFPNGRFYEDFWIMHKIFKLSNCVAYDSRQLYFYFQRPKSIMYSVSVKNAVDWYDLFNSLYNSNLRFKYFENIASSYMWVARDIKARAIFTRVEHEKREKIFSILDKGLEKFCLNSKISKKTSKTASLILRFPWIFVPKRFFAESNSRVYIFLKKIKNSISKK